jgi:tetratricopeptide (TPR) repeat protein
MIRVFVTVLTVILCWSHVHAQPREQRDIEEAARSGNWSKVESLATTALKRTPNDVSTLYILTLSQLRLGKYERALGLLQRLRTLDSVRIQPWLMISECEIALNRTPAAISTLTLARMRFPDSVQIPWALGMALARSGRYEEAIDPLEDVMYKRPDVPSITDQLARCYHATGRFSESAELFRIVVERSPSNAQAWLKLGESLLALRKLDSARQAFDVVIRLQPDSAPAYLAVTAIVSEQGNLDSARAIAQQLTRRRPNDPQGWYNYGLLSMSAKRADSAITHFRNAIRLQPTYPEAYFNLALAYEDQGFLEDAAVALRRCALSSSLLAPDAYNSLAIVYRREGRFDDALAAHAQALALRDTSAIFHASRLNTYFDAARCEQASGLIEQARKRFPESNEILYASARCYIRTGRSDDARAIEQLLATRAPALAEQLRLMMK